MLQPRLIFLAEFSDSAVSRIGDEVRVIRHQDITDYLEGHSSLFSERMVRNSMQQRCWVNRGMRSIRAPGYIVGRPGRLRLDHLRAMV